MRRSEELFILGLAFVLTLIWAVTTAIAFYWMGRSEGLGAFAIVWLVSVLTILLFTLAILVSSVQDLEKRISPHISV